jgi:hypothetical protein
VGVRQVAAAVGTWAPLANLAVSAVCVAVAGSLLWGNKQGKVLLLVLSCGNKQGEEVLLLVLSCGE